MFVALCVESLAIRGSICFHVASNASTEEVRMTINSKNRFNPMQRASAAMARALLG